MTELSDDQAYICEQLASAHWRNLMRAETTADFESVIADQPCLLSDEELNQLDHPEYHL